MAPPTLTCSINRAWLRRGASAVVFVSLDIVPAREARTAPVALVIALDASASMTGQKLEAALSAARAFSRAMGEKDAMGVVAFSGRARTLMRLTRTPEEGQVEAALEGVAAGGETNLQAGMRGAMRELTRKPIAADAVARVVVVTDGEATVGATKVEQLVKQARQMRKQGASIATVGVGEAYQAEVLTEVAAAGGGRSHHLEGDLRGLEALLGEELVEAGRVVSKSPTARLRLAPGAQLLQAFAVEPMVVHVEAQGGEGGLLELPLSDFVAGARQTLVLRLRVPPSAEGRHRLCAFDVEGAAAEAAFETTEDLAVYGSETNPHARLLLTAAEGTVIARRALTSADKTEIGRSETIIRVVESDPALRGAKRAHPSVIPLVGALARTQDALESPSLTEGEKRKAAHDATVIVRKGGGA